IGAGPRGARYLFGDVAVERLPVAAARAVAHREVHAAVGAQRLPGRAHYAMALPARHEGHHIAARDAGLRFPPEVHHDRHRVCRRQIADRAMAALQLKRVTRRYGATTVITGDERDAT